jgi:hypothetical protein
MGFLDRWIREWIGSAAKPVEKRAFTLNWIKPQDRRGEEAREGGRSGNHSTGANGEDDCLYTLHTGSPVPYDSNTSISAGKVFWYNWDGCGALMHQRGRQLRSAGDP